ncbi:Chorion peroxidase, partial [Armadillidium nasatum]
DTRVNEQPQLSIIQTMWVRQHNRVAGKLRGLNPSWNNDDEKLYQETRRIIVAEIQHIVYKEWLPIILGTHTMDFYGLEPKSSGYFNGYSTSRDATIINEFSAAAFRFGHTLVQGDLELHSIYGKAGSVVLSENFDNPALIFSVITFEQLLRGLFKQPMQNFDKCVVDDLTNKLFKVRNHS